MSRRLRWDTMTELIMQAVVYDKFGDESVLSVREILAPRPASDQVQVRVRMAGLNPLDWKLRSGILRKLGQPKRPPLLAKILSVTLPRWDTKCGVSR